MTSLKSKFVIPALLASSAFLSACDAKEPKEDLRGMTDSIAAACPTNNVTGADKLRCAATGKQHALKLVEYVGPSKHFDRVCAFKAPREGLKPEILGIIEGSQVAKCLAVIEGVTKASGDAEVARVAGETKKSVMATVLSR